jgi:hypothetical protein
MDPEEQLVGVTRNTQELNHEALLLTVFYGSSVLSSSPLSIRTRKGRQVVDQSTVRNL